MTTLHSSDRLCCFCCLFVSSSDFSEEFVLFLLFEKLAGRLAAFSRAGKGGKEGEDEEEAGAETAGTGRSVELTLKLGAELVVVERWWRGQSGWTGISWVRSKAFTWHRWNAVTPKAFPRGSFSTRASLMLRVSKIVLFLDRMYLESMLVI